MPLKQLKRLRLRGSLFLFIFFISFHLLLIVTTIYLDRNIYFLLLLELLFYLFNSKVNLKKLLRIGIITAIIFLINLISHEGRVLVSLGVIKITDYGLKVGGRSASILFTLFLYSNSIFYMNKEFLIAGLRRVDNSVLSKSMEYFFYFIDMLYEKKIKNIVSTAILVYNRPLESMEGKKPVSPSTKFYISQLLLFSAYLFKSVFDKIFLK